MNHLTRTLIYHLKDKAPYILIGCIVVLFWATEWNLYQDAHAPARCIQVKESDR